MFLSAGTISLNSKIKYFDVRDLLCDGDADKSEDGDVDWLFHTFRFSVNLYPEEVGEPRLLVLPVILLQLIP